MKYKFILFSRNQYEIKVYTFFLPGYLKARLLAAPEPMTL